jgi:hypothetical protein
VSPTDAGAVDILWFRLAARDTAWLVVPAILLTFAAVLAAMAVRSSGDARARGDGDSENVAPDRILPPV